MSNPTVINTILFILGIPCFLVVYYLDKRGWINWFRGLVVVVCIAYTLTLSAPLIGAENTRVLVISFFFAMLPVIVLDLGLQVSKLDEVGEFWEKLAKEDREELKRGQQGDNTETHWR